MPKPLECAGAPLTILCPTALVKAMSSRPSHCGGLHFNSQLQSVVNVSADSSVSFRVWKGTVGANPNGIRAPVSDGSRCVWLQ